MGTFWILLLCVIFYLIGCYLAFILTEYKDKLNDNEWYGADVQFGCLFSIFSWVIALASGFEILLILFGNEIFKRKKISKEDYMVYMNIGGFIFMVLLIITLFYIAFKN